MARYTHYFGLALILFISTATLRAQLTPVERASLAFQHSTYIFEGIVVEQFIFRDGSYYTENVVEITHIYKGSKSLDCGTVSVINPGTGGKSPGAGVLPVGPGTHAGEYYMGSKGIFFCKANSFPQPSVTHGSNPLLLKTVFESLGNFVSYEFDPRVIDTVSLATINVIARGFLGIEFEDYDSVNEFLKEGYGIDTNTFEVCDRPIFDATDGVNGSGKESILPKSMDTPVKDESMNSPRQIKDEETLRTGESIHAYPRIQKKKP